MRTVTLSAFVQAAVRRESETRQSFERIFNGAIVWSLERDATIEAEQIPGKEPPVFAFVTTAWAVEGIPPLRITFSYRGNDIELLSLAIHEHKSIAKR